MIKKRKISKVNEALLNVNKPDEINGDMPIVMSAAKEESDKIDKLNKERFKEADKEKEAFIKKNNEQPKIDRTEAQKKMHLSESLFEDVELNEKVNEDYPAGTEYYLTFTPDWGMNNGKFVQEYEPGKFTTVDFDEATRFSDSYSSKAKEVKDFFNRDNPSDDYHDRGEVRGFEASLMREQNKNESLNEKVIESPADLETDEQLNAYHNVSEHIFELVSNIIENELSAQAMETEVPGYNAEWCPEEFDEKAHQRLMTELQAFSKMVAKTFFDTENVKNESLKEEMSISDTDSLETELKHLINNFGGDSDIAIQYGRWQDTVDNMVYMIDNSSTGNTNECLNEDINDEYKDFNYPATSSYHPTIILSVIDSIKDAIEYKEENPDKELWANKRIAEKTAYVKDYLARYEEEAQNFYEFSERYNQFLRDCKAELAGLGIDLS